MPSNFLSIFRDKPGRKPRLRDFAQARARFRAVGLAFLADQDVHVAARAGADVQDHASRGKGKLEIPGDASPGPLIAGEDSLGVVVVVLNGPRVHLRIILSRISNLRWLFQTPPPRHQDAKNLLPTVRYDAAL
jgi:hypothetical protein